MGHLRMCAGQAQVQRRSLHSVNLTLKLLQFTLAQGEKKVSWALGKTCKLRWRIMDLVSLRHAPGGAHFAVPTAPSATASKQS